LRASNRVGKIALAATGLFTAFFVAVTVFGGTMDVITIMGPFWFLTLLVGAATYAAGAYVASRNDATIATIDLTSEDRITTAA
jgi:ABC-type multidrug transport system permease subunit